MYSIKEKTLSDLAEAARGYFGIEKKIKIEEIVKKLKERVLGEDLVPTSIDTDGTVYNAVGHKMDHRLSSDGTEREAKGYAITGFIPYKDGEYLHLGRTTMEYKLLYVHIYDAEFNLLTVQTFPGKRWEHLYTSGNKEGSYIRVSMEYDGENVPKICKIFWGGVATLRAFIWLSEYIRKEVRL